MTRKPAFGSYVPGTSVIHAMKAQVKTVLACAFSIAAMFVDSWLGMAIAVTVLVVLYALARVPLRRGMSGIGPVAFILIFTVLVHALSFTLDGLVAGMFVALRIAAIVFACMLLTFTTPPDELVGGLRWLLGPLRVLCVPVDDLAMVISLALRFIPLTTQEAYVVRKAQLARGADFEAGSPLARACAWTPVLVPLMVRLFRRADELADALEARCYGAVQRGGMREAGVMRAVDWLQLAIGLAAIILLAIFL